jgi:hypothetical protein
MFSVFQSTRRHLVRGSVQSTGSLCTGLLASWPGQLPWEPWRAEQSYVQEFFRQRQSRQGGGGYRRRPSVPRLLAFSSRKWPVYRSQLFSDRVDGCVRVPRHDGRHDLEAAATTGRSCRETCPLSHQNPKQQIVFKNLQPEPFWGYGVLSPDYRCPNGRAMSGQPKHC